LGAWLGARPVPIRCVPHARAPRSVDLSKRIRRRLSLAHPAAHCRRHCEQAFTVQATVEGGLHSSDGTIRGYTGIMKFTDDPQTHYGATWILVCRREVTDSIRWHSVFRRLCRRLQNFRTGTRPEQASRGHQPARITLDGKLQPGAPYALRYALRHFPTDELWRNTVLLRASGDPREPIYGLFRQPAP
jgi:hypothetical protein